MRDVRIGISMRAAKADGYDEPRDALAEDWIRFLLSALAGTDWILLPNMGRGIVDYAKAHGRNAFILTGGNDLGEAARRDETERALLDLAHEMLSPVFGVCRGLQMIQSHFGGPVVPCSRDQHIGKNHAVHLKESGEWFTVNSYHGFGVREEDLAPGLNAVALTADGWVEALAHATLPMAAVMWHPERKDGALDWTAAMMRNVLAGGGP